MPQDFLLKCLEVINIHRGGQPALYNDDAAILSQVLEGVALEDAYNYGIAGCVEPSEPGKGLRPGNLFHHYSLLKVLEITLNNGLDPRTGIRLYPNPDGKDLAKFKSFEELSAALKSQITYYNNLMVTASNCVGKAWAELTPTPFASSLMDDCIKRGKDLEWGGGHYNSAGMLQIGMANVGNCLAALKKVMFEEKRLTAEQIRHALETNFEDNASSPTGEEIRQILLEAPKYGNDDDYADLLVKDIYEFTAKDVMRYKVYTTGASCNTQTSPVSGHVALGSFCGATPDGRKASMPMNEGLSPAQGTDVKGPTATLKSVAKLNHALCSGGTLLNQKFDPAAFKDVDQLLRLTALIRTYFALKGMHIQFNVVSAATLKDAQRYPEKYSNLLVRVAGYSALFTTLEPAVQNDIISRTEQSWR
jgi:formate C-acetyltransferase